MPSVKARAWVFTINNYTEQEVARVLAVECRGIAVGKEVGEGGTPHLQGCICFDDQKTLRQVKVLLSPRVHLEKMFGTWQQAKTYALKDGNTLRDEGDGLQQGRRTDLEDCKRKFDEGATADELLDSDFPVVWKAYKAFQALEDARARKRVRTFAMPKCLWLYGASGVGKTHVVYEYCKQALDSAYWWSPDKGWWDNYTGQKIVVFNDFNGEVDYKTMLRLADKFPADVSRRGRPPHPFLAEIILVTSNHSIDLVYEKNFSDSACSELHRRFTEVKKEKDDNFTVELWLQ